MLQRHTYYNNTNYPKRIKSSVDVPVCLADVGAGSVDALAVSVHHVDVEQVRAREAVLAVGALVRLGGVLVGLGVVHAAQHDARRV